ncbi:chromosome partitioning protein ParB [Vibrio breoganii]|uniref:chromosome partitioning protein ParB n=1 Tax=Vibrio breoganii TaxID=553239 RepID=UPI000C8348BB|nr:chromosome partitioning protein ParB [Vibrio breoganii]PML28914.1 chromosome partitioning protein ParB [Vibrio breoganii]
MKKKLEPHESSEIEKVEHDLANALIGEYSKIPSQYIGSSRELIEGAKRRLSPATMMDIFKSKARYYPQLKVIETGIQHEVVHITPTLARDILQFSRRGAINTEVRNRKVKASAVKRYTKDMNEGRWCLTGQPIIIGADGELQDGHSRLEAASRSRNGFIAVLLWGVSDELSFAHIDVGSIRSRAQVLEMAGVTVDATALAQTALLAQSFENTKNEYAFRGTQGNAYQQAETMEYVKGNAELVHSVAFVEELIKKYKQQKQASAATYAFCHYLIKQKLKHADVEVLPITPEDYLLKLVSGIGVHSSDDTEFQVRDYLQKQMGQSTSYTQLCRLSSIFKGWNQLLGVPIFSNRVAVRRVAKFVKDEEGNKIPMLGAGNINEAFTVPFKAPGKIPLRGKRRPTLVD